eukprot:7083399-Prymnesium_polylepis.1
MHCTWILVAVGCLAGVAAKRAEVVGRQLLLDGKPTLLKGVCYSPVPINESVYFEPYGDYFTTDFSFIWLRDLPLIRAMGANMLRVYGWRMDNDHSDFMVRLWPPPPGCRREAPQDNSTWRSLRRPATVAGRGRGAWPLPDGHLLHGRCLRNGSADASATRCRCEGVCAAGARVVLQASLLRVGEWVGFRLALQPAIARRTRNMPPHDSRRRSHASLARPFHHPLTLLPFRLSYAISHTPSRTTPLKYLSHTLSLSLSMCGRWVNTLRTLRCSSGVSATSSTASGTAFCSRRARRGWAPHLYESSPRLLTPCPQLSKATDMGEGPQGNTCAWDERYDDLGGCWIHKGTAPKAGEVTRDGSLPPRASHVAACPLMPHNMCMHMHMWQPAPSCIT